MDKTLFSSRMAANSWLAGLLLCLAGASHCRAQAPAQPLLEEVRRFVMLQLAPARLPRVEVMTGRLDPRLRLPPCERVHPYVPAGVKLWGRTRVGLRCVKGVTVWNIYVPVTVNVYGPALVSASALPAGHVLTAADLSEAEVNLSEDNTLTAPLAERAALLGRTLARAVTPGQRLHTGQLKARQWFAAGDRVQIRVAGSGFAVAGAGEAITAGLEGTPARIRTEGGRVLSGMPVAERQVEVTL